MPLRRVVVLSCAVALTVTSCGSDEQATSASDIVTSVPATPTTSVPSTDARPSTTSSRAATTPTAAGSTTLPAPVAAGWLALDLDTVNPKAFPPCCADTWHGAVSPPLAPAGEPPADGDYAVTMDWPDDPTQPLQLELQRFEHCARLPESSCEPPPQGEDFLPDQLGIDSSTSRPLTVQLDDTVHAVVVGWATGPDGFGSFQVQQGNGVDLRMLAEDVSQAYTDVFAVPFLAGRDPEAIVAEVTANPAGGFGPAPGGGGDSVVFNPSAGGPPLLFQAVFPHVDGVRTAGSGTDVLAIRSIEIVDGQVTVHVYAGYYP